MSEPALMEPVYERAFAKLNLLLHVGNPRDDGLHPLCSIFASIDLYDDVHLERAPQDSVECPGIDGPNLAEAAVNAYRRRVPHLPPLRIRIEKRIPVAAGLGGGSADAAAALRGANRIAGDPLSPAELRELGAQLGSDVPSQVDPSHELVSGVGEIVEPIELPPFGAVLIAQRDGLAAAAVYAQFDLLGGGRNGLDPAILRELARRHGARAGARQRPAAGRPGAAAGAGACARVAAGRRSAGRAGPRIGPDLLRAVCRPRGAVTAAATIDGAERRRLLRSELIAGGHARPRRRAEGAPSET